MISCAARRLAARGAAAATCCPRPLRCAPAARSRRWASSSSPRYVAANTGDAKPAPASADAKPAPASADAAPPPASGDAKTAPTSADAKLAPETADAATPASGLSNEAPSGAFTCGGYFFTCDPNIGFWNDKTNPNYKLTFTDTVSNESSRVSYAVLTDNRGPHFEVGVRLQFGRVSCEGQFAEIPQEFDVDSGWEATCPTIFCCVRYSKTQISAGGVNATVRGIDIPLGLSLGYQRVLSGHGVRSASQKAPALRSRVAMTFFALWLVFGTLSVLLNLYVALQTALQDGKAKPDEGPKGWMSAASGAWSEELRKKGFGS